ncbi:hypothetical protein SAMN05519104_8344 [Rhizobiales bacterium GAS188]|nr:hypothetical protein SAMN05519104_8344 [Rhizobiales bacterium GAS188]
MARQGAAFGKREATGALEERESSSRMLLIVAVTAFAIACVLDAVRTHLSQPVANPTAELLKGRWVTSQAPCNATDNYIEFGDHGYDAHIHDRLWANGGGFASYWRKDSLIMIKNGGNTRNAILVLKQLPQDQLVFFDLVFDGEPDYEEYGLGDQQEPERSDLVPQFKRVASDLQSARPRTDPNQEWRQAFRTHLGATKHCAAAAPR